MINSKHYFEGINADDSIRLLANGDYLNMENLRNGVSGLGFDKELENIPSTTLVHSHGLPYTNLGIGTAVDYARKRLIRFIYNSNGLHRIIAYDIATDTSYIVLLSSQTEKGLNFSKTFRINRNAKVIGDLLLWTDYNNEPQCINTEAGIKLNQPSYVTTVAAYATPIPYETLTLIRKPPIYPMAMVKSFDGGFTNNYIRNNAYQFTAYYIDKDYQSSALAPYSALAGYNASGEDSNYIQVSFSFSETIPDFVQTVVLCVKYGNTGKTFIIKQWDKNYYYDRTAIQNHNAKSVQLGFNFYDNIAGIALDDIMANTSFDNVAIKAKTIELARNRTFLANVLKGYNTPVYSTLSATLTNVDTGAGGSYSGTWGYVTLHANFSVGVCQDTYMYPFVYIASGAPKIFYYFPSVRNSTIWNGGVGAVPPSIDINTATFSGTTEASLIAYLKATQYPSADSCTVGTPPWQSAYEVSAYNALGNVTVTNYSPVSVNHFFKSSSDYEINIEFKDRFNRKCGVIQRGVTISIPKRTYSQTTFTTALQWLLSNTDAINQIPDWAYYYQIVIKKNQTTRFFEQIRATGVQYVTKNQDDSFSYGNTYTFGITYALAIDLTALTGYGLGYTFNEGDFANLILSDNTYLNLKVLGQDGNFVWLSPTSVGTGSTSTIVLLELYTPYKPSQTEPYFEVPKVYPITSPTTINRAFSTLTDTINGDTYAIQRKDSASNLYIAEAMSPNDKIWQVWQTDTGWINFIDTIGQQLKETTVDFSDTYINGTKINGLNKFQPLNTKDIGGSSGSIQKLQLTNKQQEDGTVMLIIAEQETLSAYLSESQLYAASKAAVVVTTSDVIGTINALKNTRGTINPESISEYNGIVFAFDAIHGTFWQYSDNGITDVSEFKMHRFWDRYSKKYVSLTSAQIEALCGFAYVATCPDPSTGELLITIPQVETNVVTSGFNVGFASNLPSYSALPSYTTSIQNRFDIYDGNSKTFIYNWKRNRWLGSYGWLPDCMEYVGDKLFGIKNGNLYLFNENTSSYGTVFGVQYPQRICFTTNLPISVIKDLFDIAIEGNAVKPNYTVAYTSLPYEQITDLVAGDYENKEGVLYARFFRDRLSQSVSGTAIEKMYKGDVLKSEIIMVMIEFSAYTQKLIINFVNVGYEVSAGHLQIINPKQ